MKTAVLRGLAPAAFALSSWPVWAQDVTQTDRYVYGPGMMWWGGGWSGMLYGPLFILLVLAVVVGVVVLLTRRAAEPWPAATHPPSRAPLDILKERFARGEIDKEEYEARRRVLSE